MSCNTLVLSSYVEILSELNFLRIQKHPSELEEKFDFIRKYCSLVARLFMVLCANMTLYGTLSLLLLDKNVCQTILSTIFFQQPTLRLHCFLVHLMSGNIEDPSKILKSNILLLHGEQNVKQPLR